MSQDTDKYSDQPNKDSLNMLDYHGKRKFNAFYMICYMLGNVAVAMLVHFILEGGKLTAEQLWFSIVAGLVLGVIFYFWDLIKSRKKV